ncbi:MAG: hypothetical protein WCK05_17160, partial [Planctomycetota bacterium]
FVRRNTEKLPRITLVQGLVDSHERQALLSKHPDFRLRRAVKGALQWEPARRFPSASSMCEALCPRPFGGRLVDNLRSPASWLLIIMMVAIPVAFSRGWEASSRRANVQLGAIQGELHQKNEEKASLKADVADLQERLRIIGKLPKTYERRLTNIRARYDNVKRGTASDDDLMKLEDDCRGFVSEFPGDAMASPVTAVEVWIRDARKQGVIRVEPVEFKENTYWSSKVPMRYQINLRGIPWDDSSTIQYGTNITRAADLAGKDSFQTPWRPGKQIDLRIIVKDKEGVDHFPLNGDSEILKSEEGVIEKALETSRDNDFVFRFRIRRIGFGPMPQRP